MRSCSQQTNKIAVTNREGPVLTTAHLMDARRDNGTPTVYLISGQARELSPGDWRDRVRCVCAAGVATWPVVSQHAKLLTAVRSVKVLQAKNYYAGSPQHSPPRFQRHLSSTYISFRHLDARGCPQLRIIEPFPYPGSNPNENLIALNTETPRHNRSPLSQEGRAPQRQA